MRMHFCCLVFYIVSIAASAGCSSQPMLLCGVILPQVQKWEHLLTERHEAPVGPVSMSIHVTQDGSGDMLLNHFPPVSKSSLKFVTSIINQITDHNIKESWSQFCSLWYPAHPQPVANCHWLYE